MRIRSLFATLLVSAAIVPFAAQAAEEKARTYTKTELEQIILETILKHPEAIIESVDNMQRKQASQATNDAKQNIIAYQKSLFEDKASPVAGNPKGDVTVVEFFDYNCGYCKRSFDEIVKLTQNDKKVRIVFKEYPVLAPSSEIAARASLAMHALKPERYFDYHSALFRLGGRFDEDNLAAVAEGMGADAAKFKAKMHDASVTKHLEDTKELAAKLGARGVPLFVIGDEIAPGAISYEDMKSRVEAVRASNKKK